ncbi:MAG: DUF1275 domain-containing protein [Bacteroidetes bacterium]|nr:DUF1275 domain-containing protein [Bacteroidota bacterium]
MFRHQGKTRTYKHNLQLASVLSFVAGIVNITGFFAFTELTTNVTGHFALFINGIANGDLWKGSVYLFYIFSFLTGSFLSGFLIEKFTDNQRLNIYVLPTILEFLILTTTAVISNFHLSEYPDVAVCALLLAMGLQNSFVTKISDAVVRTTHLTGLFTDLGIDLSQLFFPKLHSSREHILANIKLRIYIISFFFSGGLISGYLYSQLHLGLNTLFLGSIILLASLFYDDLAFSKNNR